MLLLYSFVDFRHHIGYGYLFHLIFHTCLYFAEFVIHCQMNISSDRTIHIRVLMEVKQPFLIYRIYSSVDIIECNIASHLSTVLLHVAEQG